MQVSRPKNLDLFTIHFPLPAIVSVLHRFSGLALFLVIPPFLWLFSYSLTMNGFEELQSIYSHFMIRLFLWLVLIPYCIHLIAGIRHLLMDAHIGCSLRGGRRSSVIALVTIAVLIILLGIWTW